MKKLILSFALLLCAALSMSAQQVCFWTNEYKTLPIRVYIDEQYVGDVTETYKSAPQFGDEGTLSIELTPGTHTIVAVNAQGYEYDGWPGTFRPADDKVSYVKIRKDKFPRYTSLPYIVYDPYWYSLDYGPYYYHHRHHHSSDGNHGSSDYDEGELNTEYTAALIVTAASLFVSGMVGAIVNWNYPDYRFPYLSVGYKAEFLPGVGAIRNVAKIKGRIGNYGGMSFIAEGGETYYFRTGWEPTIAAGFGWAYGAFEVDFRYQLPYYTQYQFASLDFSYDWFIKKNLAIDFNLGFGLSGLNTFGNQRWNGIEVPFGVGIQYAF